MKTKRYFFGLPVMLLALGLVVSASLALAGCGGDDGDGGGDGDGVTVPTGLQGEWMRAAPPGGSARYLLITGTDLGTNSGTPPTSASWPIVSCDESTLEYGIPFVNIPASFTWVLSNGGNTLTISNNAGNTDLTGTYAKQ
jgi:hypothetical protein